MYSQEAKTQPEVSCQWDPASFYVLKVLQPSKLAPPAEDHIVKWVSLWLHLPSSSNTQHRKEGMHKLPHGISSDLSTTNCKILIVYELSGNPPKRLCHRPAISCRTFLVQRCRNVENRSNYINASTKNCITEIEMFCSETKQTDIDTRNVSSRQAADLLCRLSNWWSIGTLG